MTLPSVPASVVIGVDQVCDVRRLFLTASIVQILSILEAGQSMIESIAWSMIDGTHHGCAPT